MEKQVQETTPEKRKTVAHSEVDNSLIYGGTVRNHVHRTNLDNHQWYVRKRKGDNPSNSGPSPNKQVSAGFSQNAQATGHQTDAKIDETLSTTMHQRTPLTSSSLYINNVEKFISSEHVKRALREKVIANEANSQNKPVVTQQHVKPIQDDGICSNATATHCQFMFETIERYFDLSPISSSHFKCLICKKFCAEDSIGEHLASAHPELFFAHVKSKFMNESTSSHFNEHCKFVLLNEIQLAKKLAVHVRQNMHNMTLLCAYCSNMWMDEHRLKFHLVRHHYNVLEEKLIAHCQVIAMGKGGNNTSQMGLNVQSTSRAKLGPNLPPSPQQYFRFENNAASGPGKEMTASRLQGETFSGGFNMERGIPQNSQYKGTEENRAQGYVQKDNNSYTINTVREGNSAYLAMAAPIHHDQGRFDNSGHYGSVQSDQYFKAPQSIQGPVLGTGPNMSRNGAIPMVSSHHSSHSTFSNNWPPPSPSTSSNNWPSTSTSSNNWPSTSTSSNNWSQPTIATATQSSNYSDTTFTNHIQEYQPTNMVPGNSQYFHQPVPFHQQQQMESNQAVLPPSHSSQPYSVPPSSGNGTINDAIPDWEADLDHILLQYAQENHNNSNVSLNPPYNNADNT